MRHILPCRTAHRLGTNELADAHGVTMVFQWHHIPTWLHQPNHAVSVNLYQTYVIDIIYIHVLLNIMHVYVFQRPIRKMMKRDRKSKIYKANEVRQCMMNVTRIEAYV